jgi:hypothetical protein
VLLALTAVAVVAIYVLLPSGSRTQALSSEALVAVTCVLGGLVIARAVQRGAWRGGIWLAWTLLLVGAGNALFFVLDVSEPARYRPRPIDALFLLIMIPLLKLGEAEARAHFEPRERRELIVDLLLIAASLSVIAYLGIRPVTAGVELRLRGAERIDTVSARGSDVRRIPFLLPAWAGGLVVDVEMAAEQWDRITDFGVSVYDSAGRQLAKEPLKYALGRITVELPDKHGDMPLTLAFYPGFADPGDDAPWSVRASVRAYADSAVALAPAARGDSALQIAPGRTAEVGFRLNDSPWPLPERFHPLGLLLARAGGIAWTRELPLPAAGGGALP